MATAISGPRVLLRQLRETMAEPLASQDRLNKIVNLIAQNMRADVCSFYVLRDDGALELFATRGLNAESVHMTTLRLGEGLVGQIAAEADLLNLSNAPAHPAFAYRPETGEAQARGAHPAHGAGAGRVRRPGPPLQGHPRAHLGHQRCVQ